MLSKKKQKTPNTNNSTQLDLNNKQSSNNRLTRSLNKTNDNNITFDILNY